MAHQLKGSLCQDCEAKTLAFTEKTGIYHATSNPTGWGGDHALTDATAAYLTITLPGLDPVTFELTSNFPNTDGTVYYMTPENFGLEADADWPDGLITYEYQVVGDTSGTPFNYRMVQQKPSMCEVMCCVQNLGANVNLNCGCEGGGIDPGTEAILLLESAKYAAGCGKTKQFTEILGELQAICNKDCHNC